MGISHWCLCHVTIIPGSRFMLIVADHGQFITKMKRPRYMYAWANLHKFWVFGFAHIQKECVHINRKALVRIELKEMLHCYGIKNKLKTIENPTANSKCGCGVNPLHTWRTALKHVHSSVCVCTHFTWHHQSKDPTCRHSSPSEMTLFFNKSNRQLGAYESTSCKASNWEQSERKQEEMIESMNLRWGTWRFSSYSPCRTNGTTIPRSHPPLMQEALLISQKWWQMAQSNSIVVSTWKSLVSVSSVVSILHRITSNHPCEE